MQYRVGVDIGGTFTDFAVLDEANKLYSLKVFSTPATPGEEIVNGIRGLNERYGIKPDEISYFTHGTTVGVNSIIQRNGAKLSMLTTAGFADVLELARLRVPDVTNMFSKRAAPLVAREDVHAVGGRILHDGEEHTPLDEEAVVRGVKAAVASGSAGLVIGFMNSYRNGAHERRAREIAASIAPQLAIACSSEVWPIIREYERFLTAVLNAYVQPKMAHYIDLLIANLKAEGVKAELQISKSNGGVMRAELARTACIDALFSGTASGVIGAAFIAETCGMNNVLSIDIGGTSADISLITDARPRYSSGELVGEFALHTPTVSVNSIGGGGGSIARLDEYGVLKSGPESAGSEPGPAAYGKGGVRPTTTDAFVVCGFLGAAEIAYGKVAVHRDKAEAAVATIADKVGMGVRETAQSIIRVAVSGMYAEMMKYFARHGAETDTLSLMAFGGAGPMMACFIAREAGLNTVIVPPTPGVLSALGGLVADTRNNLIRTVYSTLTDDTAAALKQQAAEMSVEAKRWYAAEQNRKDTPRLSYAVEMRYEGQSFEVELPLDEAWIDTGDIPAIRAAFDKRHQTIFGYSDPDARVQVINLHVIVSGPNTRPVMTKEAEQPYDCEAVKTVEVYFDDKAWQAGLYDRETMRPGAMLKGPAIVAQSDTTTCVLPGYSCRMDSFRNLVLERIA